MTFYTFQVVTAHTWMVISAAGLYLTFFLHVKQLKEIYKILLLKSFWN